MANKKELDYWVSRREQLEQFTELLEKQGYEVVKRQEIIASILGYYKLYYRPKVPNGEAPEKEK